MEEESKKIENPALKIVDGHAVKDPKDYQDPDELYDVLIERIRQYHPSADLTIVQKAYQLAKDAHEGQFRKSGEPYIIHPLWVGIILANCNLDKETIVAGILHDVVEDTVMTSEEIAAQFGEEVALLVEGVTKIGQLSYSKDKDKLEMQAETLRKMFLAMSERYPCYFDQTCRPSRQDQEQRNSGRRQAEGEGTGNNGYLCTVGTASWYF